MSRGVLLFGLLVFVALAVAGLITGAIGAGFAQDAASKAAGETAEGILPKPAVHLPPQVVAPGGAYDHYVEFLHAEHKEIKYGEGKLDEHEHEVLEEGPYKGTNFIVTNTLLSSWIASIVLVGIFVIGARRAQMVPGRLQNFCEIAIEALLRFVEGTVGPGRSRLLFPVIATIFLFVVINAWIGLLPIYPALGTLVDGRIEVHLLRPAGTDINMPLALALVSFVFVEYLGLRMLGFSYFGKFVRVGSLKRGLSALFRFKILDAFQGLLDFFFVGPLEAFSEFVRLVSFTFRLFGNMTAGEILVLISAFLVPFIATVGVYGLELLVGFIQGLIFAGLTLVFAAIAMTAHEHEEHEEHH
ncbi:MAG: F0F1 ATP synthase subunit A [Chloroflexi bacterium]|nr:F0F1 ATP synthase subunit A [Chloroflexota bacterium]